MLKGDPQISTVHVDFDDNALSRLRIAAAQFPSQQAAAKQCAS
jgi:hypothetical protein